MSYTFKIGAFDPSKSIEVSINQLDTNKEYWCKHEISPKRTAVLDVIENPWIGESCLYVIDLYTKKIIATRTLSENGLAGNSQLVPSWDSGTLFHLGYRNGNKIVIESYDYSRSATNTTLLTPLTTSAYTRKDLTPLPNPPLPEPFPIPPLPDSQEPPAYGTKQPPDEWPPPWFDAYEIYDTILNRNFLADLYVPSKTSITSGFLFSGKNPEGTRILEELMPDGNMQIISFPKNIDLLDHAFIYNEQLWAQGTILVGGIASKYEFFELDKNYVWNKVGKKEFWLNREKSYNDGSIGNDLLKGGIAPDVIHGFDGSDTIDGGLRNDTLVSGEGSDVFIFSTKPAKNNFDTIDFQAGTDKILLSKQIFTKLNGASDFLFIGSAAQTPTQYLIYNSDSGVLSYDADGSGKAKPVDIAFIGKGLDLHLSDFLVT